MSCHNGRSRNRLELKGPLAGETTQPGLCSQAIGRSHNQHRFDAVLEYTEG